MLSSHNIEINRKYYDEHGIEELKGIIKHELCHYHLHIEGKGYKHRDPDFRNLLKKVGAPRHCTPLIESTKRNTTTVLRIYECSTCKYVFERKRRVNTERYVCGRCIKERKEKKLIEK